ncbi:hypothetical protein MUN81_18005 [Hymenobacter sp. 5317J-9]|uniref:hypothetical protein n=1 Tax=Hymenobacter sp. 5317J-9 TaxID=2932250 RepID=UPI001FD64B57|nr:hypothetical protein [Hymenobacter sp. 5317J-9]UOQ97121.1 hypothetical protein MUN81_18005 [Hymenobacter sp. 5317J-9]
MSTSPTRLRLGHLATLTFLVLGALLSSPVSAQQAPARAMATTGQTVWVIVNRVKADKRAQFERFVNEIFWPSAAKVGATDQNAFRHTRVLNPTKPSPDGTYAYLFIMDPVQKGVSYDIEGLLKKAFGNEKAAEYNKLFTESLAGEQITYVSTQSKY